MSRWFKERSLDTEIFANSFIVSENLRRWEVAKGTKDKLAAEESRRRLQAYLAQVQNRYPLYRELFIIDGRGTLVAKTRPFMEDVETELAPELLGSEGDTALQRLGSELVFHARREVRDSTDQTVGTLVTVSGLSEMWQRLGGELHSDFGSLRIIDENGRPLFDGRANPPDLASDFASEGVQRALRGENGIAEYQDGRGLGCSEPIDSFCRTGWASSWRGTARRRLPPFIASET